MQKILIIIIFTICTLNAKGQALSIEGGSAAVPTLLPSWTFGASLQIPIVEHLSLGASYYRWADNADKIKEIAKYPILDPLNPQYVNPGFLGVFWGNQVFSFQASYQFLRLESLTMEVGLGWSFIDKVQSQGGQGIGDHGRTNTLSFRDDIEVPSPQRLSGFLQARYNFSDNFALQGKIAAFGTEHFTATVGISFMPWGDKSSFAQLFAENKQ
jgi:hypothetical protein